jgi:uncharacterized protein (DUF488 family)
MNRTIEIYSIGHSNASFDKIAQQLQKYSIQVLVDVRSHPRSRWVPHFNKQNLESAIPGIGIEYKWVGNRLGGLPDDPAYYKPNPHPTRKTDPPTVADYDKIRRQEWFQKAINELLEVASNKRTAIMCAEEDPQTCHRSLLIGHTLAEKGVKVLHIRKNGELEPQKLANRTEAPIS